MRQETAGEVSGELKCWHRVAVTFRGPRCDETSDPNPFTDYRLDVTFEHESGHKRFVVPGHFAADGNAGNTGATGGDVWRAYFMPDKPGRWTYAASFRHGRGVAVADKPQAGEPAAFDGATGTFDVTPSDKAVPDARGRGRLHYDGTRYLKFEGSGEPFLKSGSNSPETLLAYYEFDGTIDHNRFEAHAVHAREDDPSFAGGKGKNLFGAMNYLGSRGVNVMYFLTFNDRPWKPMWIRPYTDVGVFDRFDVSKIDQWEVLFSHMDTVGIAQHVLFQERECDQMMDGGYTGPVRKLYHRELLSRLNHHPATVWNVGEEHGSAARPYTKDYEKFAQGLDLPHRTDEELHEQRLQILSHVRSIDAYERPRTLHSRGEQAEAELNFSMMLGRKELDLISLQCPSWPTGMCRIHDWTKGWIDRSAAAGKPWPVPVDEPGGDTRPPERIDGQPMDSAGPRPDALDPTHDDPRRYALWGNLMAGGSGVEWYFGYAFARWGGTDGKVRDFSGWETMWRQTVIATTFFHDHLPFTRMTHADHLLMNRLNDHDGYVFAAPGEAYCLYLAPGRPSYVVPALVNLEGVAGTFDVRWFDPREGGDLRTGEKADIVGGTRATVGHPPGDVTRDWVCLLTRRDA